jgi:multidrug efflux pump subunit AcrA (membrane-fusion protein)
MMLEAFAGRGTSGSAMDLVPPARAQRTLARLLVGAVALVGLVLVLTPWQQTSPGAGRVIAYVPEERQQNLEAPIEGRVVRWHVREGSSVKQGDPIVDLSDNDPEILMRLRSERQALEARVESARERARALRSRIALLDDSRSNAIAAAESRVAMAAQRVAAAEQAVTLADAQLTAARLNIERQRALEAGGLTSRRQLELTELEVTRSQTELERARVTLSAAKAERIALESDRLKAETDGNATIDDARASQAAAEAEVANATAELSRLDVRLSRQAAQSVVAPRSGSVFRIVANGHTGEVVKAGDVLAILVPDTTDRAVELWVSGNDLPLLREGGEARVQFEGWPAVQFSGWPAIAVGTFAGRVSLVDAADDGAGKFRVLIVPHPDAPWPDPIYLRQGVRALGWLQLGQVSLGYELWRQFNGFPPSLPSQPPRDDEGAASAKGAGK